MSIEDQQSGAEGRASISVNVNEVRRPYNSWSLEVHQLLDHIATNRFESAPRCLRVETDPNGNKWEIMTVVPGDTYDFPLQGPIATVSALESAARLLRQYHTASQSYLEKLQQREDWTTIAWMLPSRQPVELICHGDFSPYNLALNNDVVTGVFDFDTAHPGPAIWDVAFTVYCFAPFKTDKNDQLGDLRRQIERAKRFCDAYGLNADNRERLAETMIARVQALIDFMQSSQGDDYGNAAHLESYQNDVRYLVQNQDAITFGLRQDAD
jgi:aminoglycoside phosphotransferase (APT) family kinase protein